MGKSFDFIIQISKWEWMKFESIASESINFLKVCLLERRHWMNENFKRPKMNDKKTSEMRDKKDEI